MTAPGRRSSGTAPRRGQSHPPPRSAHGPVDRSAGRTPRRIAIDALVEVDAGARANVVLPQMLSASGLDVRDKALATELTYGTCRMRRACDWLVYRYARGKLDAEVLSAARLGAYQLVFTRVPAHAAVSATVQEVTGPGRSVVNAVLRRLSAQLAAGPPRWPDPATELSYPDWVIHRLAADIGIGAARAALETMNQPARATERADGYFQDLGSQLVSEYVGAGRGEVVLDCCAAPGGKATALAASGATVVAVDLDPARAATLARNAAELRSVAGRSAGEAAQVLTVVADGRRPAWRAARFDRVLVDAPCSGLGVLRRRPDARWRVQPADIDRLAELQRRLLQAAIGALRPGGTLVYSVCTLTTAETGAIDAWLAREHPELVPVAPPGAPWQPAGRGALLLPQSAGTDGMFVLAGRLASV